VKTRTELAEELILEAEKVLQKIRPRNKQWERDRAKCAGLLKKCKTDESKQAVLALFLSTIALPMLSPKMSMLDAVNTELTMRGRAGDKSAIAKWSQIAGLVLQLNKTGGVYDTQIHWQGLKPREAVTA